MLSQNLRRQSQLLLKNSVPPSSSSSVQLRRLCLLRLKRSHLSQRTGVRQLSSSSSDPAPNSPGSPEDNGINEANPADERDPAVVQAEELAKVVKVRRSRVVAAAREAEAIELPDGLNLFWLPAEEPQHALNPEDSNLSDLPPPEILDEALNNILITLHPQIQHRAVYPVNSDTPVEPTLGLYCPIEGGDYIIDATVRELARRTGAEVLVLDSVQLAAGEWGQFGKVSHQPPSGRQEAFDLEFDGEEDGGVPTQQTMTLTLLAPQLTQGRSLLPSPSRRSPARSKIKVFFDTLVNSTPPPSSPNETSASATPIRPRIVYIRDFTTLAATSSVWYPPLLAAVRQRRRGPMSRPSSAISNPMTIVFGMTPPLSGPGGSASPGSSVFNMMMNQNSPTGMMSQETKQEKVDWTESEQADRARERRLQDRLKKWERHEASLLAELPKLASNVEEDAQESGKPEVIVIGPNGSKGALPPLLGPPNMAGRPGRSGESEKRSSFFRTSILVPAKRSHSRERSVRIARRREINELSMRMGVGAIGGHIEQVPAGQILEQPEADRPAEVEDGPVGKSTTDAQSESQSMWEDWGNRIEVWPNVKKIADSAVGRVLSTASLPVPSLDSTAVPWTSVQSAWKAHTMAKDRRKSWLKDFGALKAKESEEAKTDEAAPPIDEIVERVRNEADLDPYEQRLLGCIVDSASMPTSFSQVHLPPHVIDSVRTIVSLPLLHPQAFQQGILKQHGMTGCLLFGPPGTGKTLVVRALAKEAGCRMLVITPSDIMDMAAEKLVRATFSLARRLGPCVIFLDEIDALFGARMAARESGGAAAAHRGVITEFMQEMDGLKSSREDGIIVIGATNRPFDLDDAILRRLPRRLLIDLPGVKEREEILKILLRDEVIGPDVTPELLAQKTESFSGSDLKHLCVSAALDAVKENVHVPWLSVSQPTEAKNEAESTVSSESDATPKCPPTTVEGAVGSPVPDTSDGTTTTPSAEPETARHARVLHLRNFLKALKEITPSSSESLGSLADLRRWNEEFGEGRNDRRRKQVWGKGRFGFVDERALQKIEEGKVVQPAPTTPSGSLELP
ncbi:ATPase [Coprinopsis cinerea okayama7|uniref:ATPase n=1 Tax=Coprinopsis cinerea (strain Okayama-7 / 130 / ATCC MYA-4618 / FGSC 9003) TaxID=240176 RepID=A8NFT0_COPC7|nr:ATPase [Coprinopsis cinerea okayama7\|eukprot:XP_001833362.2 ATPase [Coprinopsis cinerea okayama7\